MYWQINIALIEWVQWLFLVYLDLAYAFGYCKLSVNKFNMCNLCTFAVIN